MLHERKLLHQNNLVIIHRFRLAFYCAFCASSWLMLIFAATQARVAQWIRAFASGAKGRRFDPCRGYQSFIPSVFIRGEFHSPTARFLLG